jgi:diguanylate cyclase (GGDEF)-like protein
MAAASHDHYADHDHANTARFIGLVWIVFGVGLLGLAPVAAAGHPAALAIGLSFGLASAGSGLALTRGWHPGYGAMLALSYAGVAVLFAVQALVGSDDGRLVTELYLLIALQTAAVHAPKRTAGVLVTIAVALLVFESRGGWSAAHIADAAGHAGIWLLVALIASSLTTQLRQQRSVARAEEAEAQRLAATDALTGLGNRRRLMADLDLVLARGTASVLALFDLDGFKAYNDSFGHPAGDALLRKLGSNLSDVMEGRGSAYRMGGDEFCILAPADGREDGVIADAAQALNEEGEAFTIGASFGFVALPTEASSSEEALRSADRRMYANKASGRTSAGRQTTDVLLRVLRERHPDLTDHVEDVTQLCAAVAGRLGVEEEDRVALLQAASLHDVGKAAIPDAIINKAGPLTDDEWAFMRQHTIMGERIMAAAPSLAQAAQLVRASHERMDGTGYPDGLAGDDIPLGARIICACDAFDAMTSDRPYQPRMDVADAVAELRRCAGSQFDATVVDVLCEVVLAAVADSRA